VLFSMLTGVVFDHADVGQHGSPPRGLSMNVA
jgi:hypothetical protein